MEIMLYLDIKTYCEMLLTLASQRKCIRYKEFENSENFVLWRHDCDMSLNRARSVAELDAQFGVKSTFFILPHSEFYNVLELGQTTLVREIVSFGHDIGLHLDVNYHLGTQNNFDIEKAIENDTRLLEDIAEIKIDSFSFHNPTQEILEFDAAKYSGLINCYSKEFRETTDYASDSNGYWRHRPIPEILRDESKTRLQILTHPEWWLERAGPPRDRVLRCVYGRAQNLMDRYDMAMATYLDRDNVKSPEEDLNDYERAKQLF
jgi:peptidoglycan/xylan/chitin deacetylase (PgdA/CDA1 family)